MKICIFGAASNLIDKKYIDATEKLGEYLAQNGHELVFGAGGNGLMGAAARGFKRKGGKIHGVIPTFFRDECVEVIYKECDQLIFTETMAERKSKMEDLADAFIIVPGGIGTFEEFYEVLTLKQLGRHTKPIALYDIDGYYDKLEEFMEYSMNEGFINKVCKEIYACAETPEKVLNYIENDKPIKRSIRDLKNG
ncbi:MAG: TIGR00730 family Rossman fold protein [Ruminococcaceae bacterium]|nr:TIGR00730 family Rossman fold protein [Oscillospiraceae bacterium]